MKVLSIRAPWWWFILHAGKDIENRDWSTGYRGPILIHASKWFNRQDIVDDAQAARHMERASGYVTKASITLGSIRQFGGHVVGVADLVDCVQQSASPWFMGCYGFVLASARPIAEPIPFKARLGLFDAPPELVAAITTSRTET